MLKSIGNTPSLVKREVSINAMQLRTPLEMQLANKLFAQDPRLSRTDSLLVASNMFDLLTAMNDFDATESEQDRSFPQQRCQ